MPKELEYKSTFKSMPFLFKEVRIAAEYFLQGLSENEIKNKAKNENIFQLDTEARKNEIASIVLKRVKILDRFLLEKLENSSVEMSKIVLIFAIMKTDRLFFEFMNEVYKEKIIIKEFLLEDKDFNIFFNGKKEQSEKVASWVDYTFYKLKQVYLRALFEAGLIKSHSKTNEITKPFIEPDIVNHIKNIGDEKYLKALLGEV